MVAPLLSNIITDSGGTVKRKKVLKYCSFIMEIIDAGQLASALANA